MVNLNLLNVNRLERIYAVSNTPSYLFRHFRADSSLADFAESNSSKDLIDFAVTISKKQNRSLRDVATAYAAIVALTYRDSRDLKKSLSEANLAGLEWASDILKLWDTVRLETNIKTVSFPPKVQISTDRVDSSTTQSTIKLN